MSNLQKQINATRDYIQARTSIKPEIALMLGSSLGGLVDEIEVDIGQIIGQRCGGDAGAAALFMKGIQ